MAIIKKYFFLVIIGLFVLFTIFSGTFLKDPPIWPDEAIYADILHAMQKEGRMGTDLWLDTVPGIQQHAFIYPPVFFYLLFWLSKITSLTIVNQRLLSVIAGSFSLFIIYRIMKQIRFNTTFSILASLSLLSVNYIFIKASKISRPEIFVLTFGLLSIFYFLKWLSRKDKKNLKYLAISSACSSLAILTHLIGVMFIISLILSIAFLNIPTQRKKYLLFVTVCIFITPITLWLIQNIHVLDILVQQTSMAFYRKTLEDTWLQGLFFSSAFFPQSFSLLFIYIISLIILVSSTIILPSIKRKFSTIDFEIYKSLLLFSYVIWFFTLIGKMFWYYVFPFPLTYILLSILLSVYFKKINLYTLFNQNIILKYLTISASLFLGLININVISTIHSLYKKNTYSYNRFIQEISKNIPSNSHIFLSTIPSPYHGLFDSNKDYTFYQFPVYKITTDEYDRLLTSAEYIVFNGIHDNIMGTYIIRYIKQNRESSISIGGMDQYSAEIIKLVPPDKRKKLSNSLNY